MADRTIAVMQPYFAPYAGYFRLFAASHLFVIYDCVQFPRRGWVHRNRLIDSAGREAWLTLHLDKAPRDALICDLRFAPDAGSSLDHDLRRFPDLAALQVLAPEVHEALTALEGAPVDYIERLLHTVTTTLGLPWNVIRSSSLDVPPSLRGQERILAIASLLGADAYVNAPGGRELYDATKFAEAGIALRFLEDYKGPTQSILTRIAREPIEALAQDVELSATTFPS